MFFRLSLVLALLVAAVSGSDVATDAVPEVESTGSVARQFDFQIHTFSLGQADSTLVIFPSGFTILYDIGELSFNSRRNALAVADKIRDLTGGTHIDVGVISHLHVDHMGYVGYGGFWHLIETEGFTFGQLVDRNAGVWRNPSQTEDCDPNVDVQWLNAGGVSGTGRNWICYATDPRNKLIYNIRETADFGSVTQISPPDEGAEVLLVLGDGKDVYFPNGDPLSGDQTQRSGTASENDYSLAMRVKFGGITYAVAGDTAGTYGSGYNDAESVMAPIFGDVEIWRASHHGSGYSSRDTILQTLNPRLSLISCGPNSYGHPFQDALDRMTAVSEVFITAEICDEGRDYSNIQKGFGADIVITSTDNGVTYDVNGEYFYDTRVPKPRRDATATGSGEFSVLGLSAGASAGVLAGGAALALVAAAGVAWAMRRRKAQQSGVVETAYEPLV